MEHTAHKTGLTVLYGFSCAMHASAFSQPGCVHSFISSQVKLFFNFFLSVYFIRILSRFCLTIADKQPAKVGWLHYDLLCVVIGTVQRLSERVCVCIHQAQKRLHSKIEYRRNNNSVQPERTQRRVRLTLLEEIVVRKASSQFFLYQEPLSYLFVQSLCASITTLVLVLLQCVLTVHVEVDKDFGQEYKRENEKLTQYTDIIQIQSAFSKTHTRRNSLWAKWTEISHHFPFSLSW